MPKMSLVALTRRHGRLATQSNDGRSAGLICDGVLRHELIALRVGEVFLCVRDPLTIDNSVQVLTGKLRIGAGRPARWAFPGDLIVGTPAARELRADQLTVLLLTCVVQTTFTSGHDELGPAQRTT